MAVRPARWADLECVVELIATDRRAAGDIGGLSSANLRDEWNRPGFEVGADNLAFERRGEVVGYAAVSPRGELTVAAAETAAAEELFGLIVARAGERGDEVVTATVTSAETRLAALVSRRPFRLGRETLLMWRALGEPIDPAPPPEGISVRTYTDADAEMVHQLLNDAYGAWDDVYRAEPHENWVAWMTRDSEFDSSVWWLAERDGALAGCALHWDSGWLKDLAVASGERGRGLGAALVTQGLTEFRLRGLRRVGLKVDAANPTGAVALYERLGFRTARVEAVWRLSL